ncbi:MAG TPA: hypothetical protein VFT43_07365, partial [Candidatus Polarisedimenticolia bacterium]|nr:hypothetical protein [Candidatus Polarisedimenticolia bacterium]
MSTLYASVAVPRPVRRLFTYSVPPHLAPRCRRGVRVMVPFGRRKLTGYLLEISESASDTAPGLPLRPLEEVLDPDPVLDESILDLTRWAAEYYIASWGEMIRSALPGMKAVVRRVVRITTSGSQALQRGGGALLDASLPKIARDPLAREILGEIDQFSSESGAAIRLEDLRRRIGARFKRTMLRRLERERLVEILEVTGAPGPRPRLEERVHLASPAIDSPASAPRGPRQREILRRLEEAGGALAAPALLEGAKTGRAALRALAARGLVRIETVDSPRRPLSLEIPTDPIAALTPTPEQQAAIDSLGEAITARRFSTTLLQGVTG